MATKTRFRQCEMLKNINSNIVKHVAWIPEEFAEIGRVLKIKMMDELTGDKVWVDGWKVHFVGSHVKTSDNLPDSHKSIRAHRKATGDNLPKMK